MSSRNEKRKLKKAQAKAQTQAQTQVEAQASIDEENEKFVNEIKQQFELFQRKLVEELVKQAALQFEKFKIETIATAEAAVNEAIASNQVHNDNKNEVTKDEA